jgi:signal transduction histidine kinase
MSLLKTRGGSLDMKTTIEMFLCLARETDDELHEEEFLVAPVLIQAIDLQRHLLSSKLVDVEISHLANPSICGHRQAFAIAGNNLVRNAFEHTCAGQGTITVRIKERELLVTNQVSRHTDEQYTLIGASSRQGYGLGLGIVERLCERYGWSFSLRADEARVATCLSW